MLSIDQEGTNQGELGQAEQGCAWEAADRRPLRLRSSSLAAGKGSSLASSRREVTSGPDKQFEFDSAAAQEDRSLLAKAFDCLACDDGHYECYGDTVGGAASCYIARMGSVEDKRNLIKALKRDPNALELSRQGLWDAVEHAEDLILKIFDLSSDDQRQDTLDLVGIELSEATPIAGIVEGLFAADLSVREYNVLKKYIAESPKAEQVGNPHHGGPPPE